MLSSKLKGKLWYLSSDSFWHGIHYWRRCCVLTRPQKACCGKFHETEIELQALIQSTSAALGCRLYVDSLLVKLAAYNLIDDDDKQLTSTATFLRLPLINNTSSGSFFYVLNLQDYLLLEINHNMFHFQIKLLRMIYVFATESRRKRETERWEENEAQRGVFSRSSLPRGF